MSKIIGLKRLTVKLSSHNKKWERLFELEKKKLEKIFPNIEHIGSTAIKGIKAKPIIDIDAGILNIGKVKNYIEPLKKLNYEFRQQSSKKNHALFVKGKESNRTHYLHIIKYKGKIWENDIFFRDYLNKNKQIAKNYEKLKTKLSKKFANNRPLYTKAKKEFIKNIVNIRKTAFR